VDSEHSAIFQCLEGQPREAVERIILTASGGPFWRRSPAELEKVSVAEALAHPVWKMGKKITIDSATLMNKGLEVIEAHYLFGLPPEQIEVLIHPKSVVHSLVQFKDGAMLAQLSVPDMRLPIQYALLYPERLPSLVRPLDLAEVGKLEFERADPDRFPALRLAFEALRRGGTYPAVLSAADEIAVQAFLEERISFVRILAVVEEVLARHVPLSGKTLEEVLAADRWARAEAETIIKK
jgi:1-deoxy-D-xylulose-5-phosphate reductoisomerase